MSIVEKAVLTNFFQKKLDLAISENQKCGKIGNFKDADYYREIIAYTEQLAYELGLEITEDNACIY